MASPSGPGSGVPGGARRLTGARRAQNPLRIEHRGGANLRINALGIELMQINEDEVDLFFIWRQATGTRLQPHIRGIELMQINEDEVDLFFIWRQVTGTRLQPHIRGIELMQMNEDEVDLFFIWRQVTCTRLQPHIQKNAVSENFPGFIFNDSLTAIRQHMRNI